MSLQSIVQKPLSGRRVLVVEDEYFLADDIVQILKEMGARIVGPVGELEEATKLVNGDIAIDAAVVDVNLRSELAFPLARILRARKVPFVFTTGYDCSSIEQEFQDIQLWEKPLDLAAMARDLVDLIGAR
ncbi:MAG TPA: response regulator [Bradyrhizobium sp.]|jgi:CheY-like chemotaxis protein|uniref:response regulator n=1 Tax=Bradyrhizobium sp. TaxID=376 RepID=UPI002B8427DD|nr:response regulator [Bradyrhizobium sp.]HXB78867.1 response regulator [Bradyrhizobium sp.]